MELVWHQLAGHTVCCARCVWLLIALSVASGRCLAQTAIPERHPIGPQTLEQAWTIALTVDAGLSAKHWNHAAVESELLAAKSQRWPFASTNAGYHFRDRMQGFRFSNPSLPSTPTVFPYVPDEGASFQATIGVPLYTSGRLSGAVQAAEAEVIAADWAVTAHRLDVKLQTAAEYIAVLRAEQELQFAADSVRSLAAHVYELQQQFQQQRTTREELLQAEISHEQGRHTALLANHQLDLARAAYNRRLHRDLTTEVCLAPLQIQSEVPDVVEVTGRALLFRPELAQLQARVAALRHQADSLQANHRPQVQLNGAYNYQENPFVTPEGVASVGIDVSWNLLDSGRTSHETDAIRQEAEALARLADEMQSLIQLEVREAWLRTVEAQQWMQVTHRALAAAEETLRISERRHQLGSLTTRQLLDAQAAHSRRRRDHLHAGYDAALMLFQLQRASGGL